VNEAFDVLPLAPHAPRTKTYKLKDDMDRSMQLATTVLVSAQAHAKMCHWIERVPVEVGWLGLVREGRGGIFTLDDVLLPVQTAMPATNDIDADALGRAAHELLAGPDGTERIERLRLWGHSHVDMPTKPSTTDEKQMDSFAECGVPFMIRAIGNRKGHLRFDVFHYDAGIAVYDVAWAILPGDRRLDVAEQDRAIADRVTIRLPKPAKSGKKRARSAAEAERIRAMAQRLRRDTGRMDVFT
jgi:hypothetical protein